MPVPNEITFTDMSRIFSEEATCNGQGKKYAAYGEINAIMPCDCATCESGKAERKQSYKAFEDRLAAVKEALDERKNDRQSN